MGDLSVFDNLPLGFRFKPTDVELIDHYLRLKINGKDDHVSCIHEVDICKVEPWDLPGLSAIKTYDHEWFFFCPRDRKYPNGHRSNRATEAGYWKATGKDRSIKSKKMGLIGMKKTLVFYTGRAPKGQRTHWVIHEYRPTIQELDGSNPGQRPFVLCRLFKKADDIKPDENDDSSNIDEVEINVLSPNQTNTSHEEARSELAVMQASPKFDEQQQHRLSKNFTAQTPDSITSEATMPDHYHSFEVNEKMAHEVNPTINYYHDVDLKPQSIMNVNKKMASMEPLPIADIGYGFTGIEFDDTDGRDSFCEFLDSIIVDEDESYSLGVDNSDYIGKKKASINANGGSCSGSDVEASLLQYDTGLIGCITSGNQPAPFIASTEDDIFSDAALDRFCNSFSSERDFSTVAPHEDMLFLTELTDSPAAVETGIKIKPRDRKIQPSLNTIVEQGDANRRIRFLRSSVKASNTEDDNNSKPLLAEMMNLTDEVVQNGCTDVSDHRTKGFGWGPVLYPCLILVCMFAFLFMAVIGLWKPRKGVVSLS